MPSKWEEQLRAERKALKKAVRRLETAERWALAGEKVDARLLSLDWQWRNVMEDAEQKNRARPSTARSRNRTQTEIPAHFESLP
jgi:hypothetical protein